MTLLSELVSLACENTNIVEEALDELRVFVRFAIHHSLPLIQKCCWGKFDFQLVFLVRSSVGL